MNSIIFDRLRTAFNSLSGIDPLVVKRAGYILQGKLDDQEWLANLPDPGVPGRNRAAAIAALEWLAPLLMGIPTRRSGPGFSGKRDDDPRLVAARFLDLVSELVHAADDDFNRSIAALDALRKVEPESSLTAGLYHMTVYYGSILFNIRKTAEAGE